MEIKQKQTQQTRNIKHQINKRATKKIYKQNKQKQSIKTIHKNSLKLTNTKQQQHIKQRKRVTRKQAKKCNKKQ